MKSIQKMRYETAMVIFHADPIGAYEMAIMKHARAIKTLKRLIKKLNTQGGYKKD